jgi:hypothetical protein
MRFSKAGWLGVGCLLWCAIDARAATIYAHSFGGSSTSGLNGVVPNTDGYTGTAGPHAWHAHAVFHADGSINATNPGGSASLPFVPVANNVYTFKAELNATAANAFLEFGFQAVDNIDANLAPIQAVAWVRMRGTPGQVNGVELFTGPSTTGPALGFGLQNNNVPAGLVELSIVLDTTQPNWRATWFANGTPLANHTYAINPTINFIGVAAGNATAATLDNLSLTSAVPEPASAALAAVAGTVLLIRRRARA